MIKELILAIILGCLLGFGVTGGYLAVKKNSTPSTAIANAIVSPIPTTAAISTSPKATVTPTPATNTSSGHQLIIDAPENESVSTTSTVKITGTTSANSSVIIATAQKSYITNSDNTGNFNLEIEIDSGVNLIQVSSFDSQDNQASSQILVTYSTAKF